MAKGYFIQKDPRTGNYYALKGGETSKLSPFSLFELFSFLKMGCKIKTIKEAIRFAGLIIIAASSTT